MNFEFDNNINIINIYRLILVELGKKDTDEYLRQYALLESSVLLLSGVDRIECQKQMSLMGHNAKIMRKTSIVKHYQEIISPTLKSYIDVNNGSFMFGIDKCTNITKRIGIILKFFMITNKYVNLTYKTSFNIRSVCMKCFDKNIVHKTHTVCEKCGYVCKDESIISLIIENGRIKSKNTYDANKNFRKEIQYVCGAINKVQDGQIEIVENFLIESRLEITRQMVRGAIKSCGYDNYCDTNYIYSHIKEDISLLPNLMPHMEKLSVRFDKYYDILYEIPDREGENVTNIHFLIQLFLYQENIEYDKSWFKILSGPTISKHIRNAIKVCRKLSQVDKSTNWSIPTDWHAH